MLRSIPLLAACTFSFALGLALKSAVPTQAADPQAISPQVIHVGDILAGTLPKIDVRGEQERRMFLLRSPETTIFIAQVEPGEKVHPSPVNVYSFVVGGSGHVDINGTTNAVKAGDLVELPKGTMHAFSSDGSKLSTLVFAISP